MKVLFFGYGPVGAAALATLQRHGHEVAAVVTHRDDPALIEHQAEAMTRARRELKKPAVAINSFTGSPEGADSTVKALHKCVEAGVPVFHTFHSGASAIRRFIDYHSRSKEPPCPR